VRLSTLASLFFTVFLDSGFVALPIELVLAGYVVKDPSAAWAFVLVATAAAVGGNFVPYGIGRFAGHIALQRWPKIEELRQRFEDKEFLAIFIPGMLPVPYKPFVAAAGLFRMPVAQFATAVAGARLIRYTVVAVLAYLFGEGAVGAVKSLWRDPVALAIFTVLALGALLLWWVRRKK
jgi:membrane protein YqaA with SNARE-associated domain